MSHWIRAVLFLFLLITCLCSFACNCKSGRSPSAIPPALVPNQPNILLVVAHPDDEYCMAATVYRIARELNGHVDELVITSGEGGYKYTDLANKIYGVDLKDKNNSGQLKTIREKELEKSGVIIGIRNHYYLRQPDNGYTTDPKDALEKSWDKAFVLDQISKQLAAVNYDLVMTLLPTPTTHGHHQAATILALQAINKIDVAIRPSVVGCANRSTGGGPTPEPQIPSFSGLKDYPETAIPEAFTHPSYFFDRDFKFGFNNKLSYQIVVNWMIAEHKSQGVFQSWYNAYNNEDFWVYGINSDQAVGRITDIFNAILPLKPAPAAGP